MSTPKKVKQGIIEDLAMTPKNDPGCIQRMAADWGVPENTIKALNQRKKQEIAMLREANAERGLQLVALTDDEILKDLQDPEKMAETPLRDKAQARERLANSSVTLLEGHQAKVSVDIKGVMEMQKLLAEDDSRMKRVKATVIQP